MVFTRKDSDGNVTDTYYENISLGKWYRLTRKKWAPGVFQSMTEGKVQAGINSIIEYFDSEGIKKIYYLHDDFQYFIMTDSGLTFEKI